MHIFPIRYVSLQLFDLIGHYSSTVKQRTLTPSIMVRIQVPQPGSRPQIAAYLHSFQGTFALLAKGPVCNPCLQNELSPISQEGHGLNSLSQNLATREWAK